MGEREAARAKRAPAKRAPVKRAPAKRAPRKRATTSKTTKGSSAHLELIRAPDPEATRAAEAKARRTSIIMLLIPTAVLTVLGLIMILSAGSISAVEGYGTSFWYFNRQVFYAVAGLIAMAVAWRLPYTVWQKLCVPMLDRDPPADADRPASFPGDRALRRVAMDRPRARSRSSPRSS